MLQGGGIEPHFLYHRVVAVFALVPHLDFANAALAATLGFYILLSLVLYHLVRGVLTCSAAPSASLAAVLITLALMLVSHITLFTWDQRDLYLGYIGINVYHNPTMVALKPFTLLLFLYASAVFCPRSSHTATELTAAVCLTLASTLAKPSYTICLLPALFAFSAYRLLRRDYVDRRLLLGGIVVPALVTLAWQYEVTYVSQPSSIVFAPLAVMRMYSSSLLPKFLLSVLFPLLVAVLFWRRAIASAALSLAWLTFMFGAGYTYLLAEAGPRMAHGNFGWSAEISLFILFVVSALFVLREGLLTFPVTRTSWKLNAKLALCALGFGLHLVSGVLWYAVHVHRSQAVRGDLPSIGLR
jgi:hypothetical protein